MKIVTKFGVGIGLLVLALAGYFSMVTLYFLQQREVADRLNQRYMPSIVKFSQITSRVMHYRSTMYARALLGSVTKEEMTALNQTRDEALQSSVADLDEIIALLDEEEAILEQLSEFAGYYGEVDSYTSRIHRGFEGGDFTLAIETLEESTEAFESLKDLGLQISESLQTATDAKFASLEELSRGFNVLFAVLFGVMILGTALVFILTRMNIQTRIRRFSEIFARGAAGDLTVRMPVGSKDELSALEKDFNAFIEQLQGIMTKIQGISHLTDVAGANLSSHSEELSATMKEIDRVVDITSRDGELVKAKIEESFKKTVEIEGLIGDIDRRITHQNQAIQNSSSSVEEIAASMNNMSTTVRNRKKAAEELAEKAKEGEANMRRTQQAVQAMSATAEQVVTLVRLIEDIAAKTNILALNAAIQAARAGVYGKSFAVVAEEIRKLSETTAKSATDIFASIQEIRDRIQGTKDITEVTEASSVAIFAGMQEVSAGMAEIMESISQLTQGTGLIRDSLSLLVSDSRLIGEASKTISLRSTEVERIMSETLEVTDETTRAISQTRIGVEEIGRSTEYLRNQALESREQTAILNEELQRFELGTPLGKSEEPEEAPPVLDLASE